MGDKSRKGFDSDTISSESLMLAWGITIRKSQGLTLEKVVVELGEKDFAAGLSFVAISRVKTLKGLAFCTHFDHAQLKKPKETDSMLMLRRV